MSGNIWLVGRVSQYFYTDLDYILGVNLVVYCTILLLDYNLVVELSLSENTLYLIVVVS